LAPKMNEVPRGLDPGIHDTVARLIAAGFRTTDSGDGVSKPRELYDEGYALPFPHVFAETKVRSMVQEAHRMAAVLGPEWAVDLSYSTEDRRAILFAFAKRRFGKGKSCLVR
jgi:hypothetical protein